MICHQEFGSLQFFRFVFISFFYFVLAGPRTKHLKTLTYINHIEGVFLFGVFLHLRHFRCLWFLLGKT